MVRRLIGQVHPTGYTDVPESQGGQGWDRYAYNFNNPVNYIDPSGHFPWPIIFAIGGAIIGGIIGNAYQIAPWNPPQVITDRVTSPITSSDMTDWLRNQMVTNSQSAVVSNIRENWTSGDPLKLDAAMQSWSALVGTGATWDFKVDLKEAKRFDIKLGNIDNLSYDAVANIHFGFVGRAAGFGESFLVEAAGGAQLITALKSGNPNDWGACNTTSFCDHPFATWSIKFGSYLYDLYNGKMDMLDNAGFSKALDEYIRLFGAPPPPPPGVEHNNYGAQ